MKDIFVSGRNGYGSGVANPAEVGQLVEKLELKATPTRWNTSGLPGGLYYYRAEQDGKMVTGKVVLLGE